MAYTPIPANAKFTAKGYDVLNAIRNNATSNYRNYVPVADPTVESLRNIGNIIMDMTALKNEFANALINRIALVVISSKMYTNPWSRFKRGILELGETTEEIFVNLVKVYEFDPAVSSSKIFKREIPDIRAAYHIMNYQKYYPVTVSDDQLRQAFVTWNGLADLIAKIVTSIYASASYDEFLVMKYLLARHILNGDLYSVTIPEPTAANSNAIVTAFKGVSNNIEFLKTDYNKAGVATHTDKNDQYLLVSSGFDAIMNVATLSAAFNMDKAEFDGHKILLDSFGDLDTDRLNMLFKDSNGNYLEGYSPLSSDELAALNAIPAVLVDRDFFMIFDNLNKFTEVYDPVGLYWNYFFHQWKTFSISPFANAIIFQQGTPSVTSVTITNDTVTAMPGSTVRFDVAVVTANFAGKAVNWTVDSTSAAAGVVVDIYGTVTIPSTVDDVEITVTATSAYDSTKSDTATITVGTPT